jgi:hypothetical protein
VWRLELANRGPSPVIAKRCLTQSARVERIVYEDVLPGLPVSAPRCFGAWEESSEYSWLFFEDAGAERFSSADQELRALAARWLAALHLGTTDLRLGDGLPRRDAEHYLGLLCLSRDTILRDLSNPAFDGADRAVLDDALAELYRIESEWPRVERFCDRMPSALVHGDFRSKNIFVRRAGPETELLPIDWETAGWGVPAADLARSRHLHAEPEADLAVYAEAVGGVWEHVDETAARRLSEVGLVFRRLMAIAWASESLQYPWPVTPLARIQLYVSEISDARARGAWPP